MNMRGWKEEKSWGEEGETRWEKNGEGQLNKEEHAIAVRNRASAVFLERIKYYSHTDPQLLHLECDAICKLYGWKSMPWWQDAVDACPEPKWVQKIREAKK